MGQGSSGRRRQAQAQAQASPRDGRYPASWDQSSDNEPPQDYLHDPDREVAALCCDRSTSSRQQDQWVTADVDGVLRLCSLTTKGVVKAVAKWHHSQSDQSPITDVAYVGHSGLIASAGRDCMIRIWSTKAPRSSATPLPKYASLSSAAAATPAAAAGGTNEPDLTQRRVVEVACLDAGSRAPPVALAAPPQHLCQGRSECWLVSGTRDTVLSLWDIICTERIATFKQSRNVITHIAWNPADVNSFAQTAEDRHLRIRDVRSLDVTIEFPQTQHILSDCDVHSDGNTIVTTQLAEPTSGLAQVMLWDVRKPNKAVVEYKGFSTTCYRSKFVPTPGKDGVKSRSVATVGEGSVFYWDTTSANSDVEQKMVGSLVFGRARALDWSHSSGIMCCGGTSGAVSSLHCVEGHAGPQLTYLTPF